MPMTVNNAASKIAGVQAHLKDTWRQKQPIYEKQQEWLLFKLNTEGKQEIRNATWVWKETTAFPNLWMYGKPRQYSSFVDRYITMNLVPYSMAIEWSKFDDEDDQLGDMKMHAQRSVERFLMLPDVLIAEYFNGTASLNPDLLSAYDGASIFSATNGSGAARGGATGGNIVTGTGITPAAIMHDLFRVQQRFLSFVDPNAGKPILSPDEVKFENMMVVNPVQLNEVVHKAADSENLKVSTDNMVSETNILKGRFEHQENQYLTSTTNWFVVLKHPMWRPFAYRAPKSVDSVIADINNSDRMREFYNMCIYANIRTRLGPYFPLVIIEVTN